MFLQTCLVEITTYQSDTCMPKQSRIKNNADSISLGFALFLSGVPGGSRTHDLPLRRRTLYPTELRKHLRRCIIVDTRARFVNRCRRTAAREGASASAGSARTRTKEGRADVSRAFQEHFVGDEGDEFPVGGFFVG